MRILIVVLLALATAACNFHGDVVGETDDYVPRPVTDEELRARAQ